MAKDGSFVVGYNAVPYPVAGTIPWLRLQAKSTGAGPYGDTLAPTTYIQRIDATGGVAPDAATCNATTAGTQVEVAYTADYLFYRGRSPRAEPGHVTGLRAALSGCGRSPKPSSRGRRPRRR